MKNQPMIGMVAALGFMLLFIAFNTLAVEPGPDSSSPQDEEEKEDEKKDDWVLSFPEGDRSGGKVGFAFGGGGAARSTGAVAPRPKMAPSAAPMSNGVSLGFAVGGAKDVNNFRENIEEDYLPLPSDLTVEGLYYDYFFDTGTPSEPCEKLFCPVYSLAVSPDPLSGKEEYFMSVGLTSDMKADDFERKKLNLVVVLDISGSMGSPFDRYYYDGKKGGDKDGESDKRTKMQIANEAVQNLTRHLRDDDRFGMVVFDDGGYLAKPLNPVRKTDMDKIRDHIGELTHRGGTNFEAGYKKGTELFEDLTDADADEFENRIVFLTDAMPNRGQTDDAGLFGLTERNARKGVHTTFIGVGIDFNSELIEAITKVRGANYYSVHSAKEFKKLLADDFEYMVTPMVFDLSLRLVAKGVGIETVYGSPEADLATGEMMRVNTLFPSRAEDGEVKGGLVLLKLDGDPRGKDIKLMASYERRDGVRESDSQKVSWPAKRKKDSVVFENSGIRKGVLLARYANLLVNWMREERSREGKIERITESGGGKPVPVFCSLERMPSIGICCPPFIEPKLGRWERTSMPLKVRKGSAETFETFLSHFDSEMKEIGDTELEQESEVLKQLVEVAGSQKKKKTPGGKKKKNEDAQVEAAKKDDWILPESKPDKKR